MGEMLYIPARLISRAHISPHQARFGVGALLRAYYVPVSKYLRKPLSRDNQLDLSHHPPFWLAVALNRRIIHHYQGHHNRSDRSPMQ